MSLSEQAQNLLQLIPNSGSIGNVTLRKNLFPGVVTADDVARNFVAAKTELLNAGVIKLGRGKGGSVRRVVLEASPENPQSGQVENSENPQTEVAATEEF